MSRVLLTPKNQKPLKKTTGIHTCLNHIEHTAFSRKIEPGKIKLYKVAITCTQRREHSDLLVGTKQNPKQLFSTPRHILSAKIGFRLLEKTPGRSTI